MIYQTVVAASVLALANAQLFTAVESHQKYMWESYKREWNRSYESEEVEAKRFAAFIDNLRIADQRNALERQANGTAVHGITRFSDLSQEEFASRYLLSNPALRSGNAPVAPSLGEPNTLMGLVDWTGKYTTPVKNQGYCGSCWAFSATSQIESDAIRTLGVNYVLSPEQITQCDKTSYGCNGGWTENAYNYVKGTGGIETEANYPYTSYYGTTGTCSASSSKYVIKVTGYTTVSGESNMATYTQQHGPLSVCVDANNWNSYTGGIMTSCGKSVDHCVQAVGVDASTGGYWKVRNSWGTSWGEAGHIRLAYGQNTCAITHDPTYVGVALH